MDKSIKRTVEKEGPIEAYEWNINWLLYSGVRIEHGPNRGALYGWKYLKPSRFPFIYTEITGYAMSFYSWVSSELSIHQALDFANESAEWIKKRMIPSTGLLCAGYKRLKAFNLKGNLSNQIYAFDNGIVMIGLLNLYKLTSKSDLLTEAERIAKNLIKYFFSENRLVHALLSRNLRPLSYGLEKWSSYPGAYHAKLAIGFLELSRLTGNSSYFEISCSLCDLAASLQAPDGRFLTFSYNQNTYFHQHLYACEGLALVGARMPNKRYYDAALKGIMWGANCTSLGGGVPENTSIGSAEQSDCTAQLLRLLILCYPKLSAFVNPKDVDDIIDKMQVRLLDFCITEDEKDRGGIKYNITSPSVCAWCTMFSAQALYLYRLKSDYKKLDGLLKGYFV